jgi:hypothetical protein
VGQYAQLQNGGQLKIGPTDLIKPGILFCLRQKTDTNTPDPATNQQAINPLHPYYLAYVYADGTTKYSYVNTKQILEIFRLLCQDQSAAYETLCDLFNADTQNGADMSAVSDLLKRAVESTTARVRKKIAVQAKINSNAFLIPEEEVEPEENPGPITPFDLITWLVIK